MTTNIAGETTHHFMISSSTHRPTTIRNESSACGTSDMLIGVNRQFKAYLDSKGLKHTFTEIPDQGHVWPLWRQNLADFAPLLFKQRTCACHVSCMLEAVR